MCFVALRIHFYSYVFPRTLHSLDISGVQDKSDCTRIEYRVVICFEVMSSATRHASFLLALLAWAHLYPKGSLGLAIWLDSRPADMLASQLVGRQARWLGAVPAS